MATEHLRKLWREAQTRRRARLALSDKRHRGHKPSAKHPWVQDKARAVDKRDESIFAEVEEDSECLPVDSLYRELGLFAPLSSSGGS